MYAVHFIPPQPVWAWVWAICVLVTDLVNAFFQLPIAIVSYVHDVVHGICILLLGTRAMKRCEGSEPRNIRTVVPFIGHMYNIFTKGSEYVCQLE